MKTIAEQWLEFSTMVLPDSVSDVQRTEMRKAFYGGFHACLMSNLEAAELPVAEGVAVLEKFRAEGDEFVMRMLRGAGQ